MTPDFREGWVPPNTPIVDPGLIPRVKRPQFSTAAVLADFLLPAALIVVVSVFALHSTTALWVGLCAYFLIRLKRIALWAILLYQKYASENIRNSCVFTPTCSQYTLEAIEKYGLIAGIIKGWKRLNRCYYDNRGEDPLD